MKSWNKRNPLEMCFNQKLQVFETGAIFSYSHEAEYVYISCDLRLQDYCERLMFYDPIEYGRKADDMLWRRVFYDVIQLTKQNKNVRACPSLLSVRPLYSIFLCKSFSCSNWSVRWRRKAHSRLTCVRQPVTTTISFSNFSRNSVWSSKESSMSFTCQNPETVSIYPKEIINQ